MGQPECIPQNWANIQRSEFYEEWLNAMELELEKHNEIGTFSADVIPKGGIIITAKWVLAWKTDSHGYITEAKARLVARGFGQQSGVDYFNMLAPTETVSSIKVALVIAVQNNWPLYRFNVKQAFFQENVHTEKPPYGCGERTGKVVKLNHALYGIKQTGRQCSAVFCQTLIYEHGMEQCRAHPCVYRRIVEGVVELVLVVHIDGILVSGNKEACDELNHALNEISPTENLGGVEVVSRVRCKARLATGQCNNQTTNNDRYPH